MTVQFLIILGLFALVIYGLGHIMSQIIILRADTECIKEVIMKKSAKDVVSYILQNPDAYQKYKELMNK